MQERKGVRTGFMKVEGCSESIHFPWSSTAGILVKKSNFGKDEEVMISPPVFIYTGRFISHTWPWPESNNLIISVNYIN